MPLPLFLLLLLLGTAAVSTAAVSTATSPPPSPSPFAPILAELGFRDLAVAAGSPPCSSATWRGPTTIFAPSDSSLLTCPSCSVPLLFQEHTVAGLYTFHYLSKLAFGTKIETLASGRCLTVTSEYHRKSGNITKVFVGGVEITRPDLFKDGNVVVHGIQGFVSHLSPLSCTIERMTSLSFPSLSTTTDGLYFTRLLLKDAMLRLRISGFSILSLALKVKYSELLDLRAMTVFAIDDDSIFSEGEGNAYVSNLRFHIIPNRRLTAADLESMPPSTVLPTMEYGQSLVVTSSGGGGPMRINYVKVTRPDVVTNLKVAVHGVSMSFSRVNPTVHLEQIGRWCRLHEGSEVCEMEGPTPGPASMVEIEDHPGFEM